MTRLQIILLALLAGCCPTAPAPHVCVEIAQRTFKVERIVDADTFKVIYDGEQTSVRIAGIDAPEKRDAKGPAATKALAKLIKGKTETKGSETKGNKGVRESAGINRLGIGNERVLQRRCSQSLWPRTVRWRR